MTVQFLLDNLQGKHIEMKESNRNGQSITAFGMCFFEKCLTAINLEKSMFIASDDLSAKRAYEHIYNIIGDRAVFLPSRDDVLLYKREMSGGERSVAYSKINSGDYRVIITCVTSLVQLVADISLLDNIKLKVGETIDRDKLIEKLVAIGYTKCEMVSAVGDFSVRGEIIDVFSAGNEYALRLDFFDDLLENIKQFDIETKLSVGQVADCDIMPTCVNVISNEQKQYILKKLDSQKLSQDYKCRLRQQEIIDDLKLRLDMGEVNSFLLPFMQNPKTILDYIPSDVTLIFDEPKQILDKLGLIYLEHMSRFEGLLQSGEAIECSYNQLITQSKLIENIDKHRKMAFQVITTKNALFTPNKLYSFRNSSVTKYNQNINELLVDLKNWLDNKYDVVIFGSTAAENMREQLFEYGFKKVVLVNNPTRNNGITISSQYLKTGIIFHDSKLVVLGTEDIIARREKIIKRKKKDVFLAPEVGDYVVHPVHGIGLCKGIKRLDGQIGLKDFVVVEYCGGDMLYVPIDQMDLLSKYSGEGAPRLNKIGGKEFEKAKARVRESVKELAFDLHKLYLERSREIGFKFSQDTPFQQEFEDKFPHAETEDQLKVVAEIKADMESDKVMDRLLVGDVGYGKTEVALRAMFKAVMDNKQVAMLCPTTILSEQHFKTAVSRCEGFGIRIEALNRFKSSKQVKLILKKLEEGEVDILIGTHRILGKDVIFKDLGLLVVDEEQRFGVEHKERIKNLKYGIDVLSMSATPIPRTLHMSMVGIRDISVIETPPQKRLPIQSYVIEQTDAVIRDAITKELARGGQVFVLDNRVEKIDKIAAKVRELVPESEIVKVHGQMPEEALENAIHKFYNNKANVMICTTIIENGIDLPNANTLIVIDSDRLGLSQLYQLRGRVGRSDRLAYCYFTTKQGKVLSEIVYKRLTAIMEFTDFGSGFKIAMRDLELRGAGDVLGAKQHGHMDKVGYDMYVKLLAECVDELKGITHEEIETTIDAHVSGYIDNKYIISDSERMRVYRRIADCASLIDKQTLIKELEDVYGKTPLEVLNLIDISLIKKLASSIGASTVTIKPIGSGIAFVDNRILMDKKVIEAVQQFSDTVMLSVTDKPAIIFKTKGLSISAIIQNALDFLIFCKN